MIPPDEQGELRSAASALLTARADEASVREHMARDDIDRDLWQRMADMGLQGLAIPERLGGSGAGLSEQGIVLEELGRSLACVPYLSTVGLAVPALLAAEDEAVRERWLPGIADGSLTATLAVPGLTSGGWYCHDLAVTASRSGSGAAAVLNGSAAWVLDGATADLVLVAARDSASASADIGLYAVEGVPAAPVATSDQTRRVAHLTLEGHAATRVGGADLVRASHRAGVALLACEQTGGAGACLDAAVSYASVRQQFGRPIGSFQAVAHQCADMLVAVESARSAARHAVRALDESADVALSPWIAGAVCGDAYAACASRNVQVHGGIGFTWEHGAQLHVKRSRGSLVLLGTPEQHRTRLLASGKVLVGA